MIKRLFTKGETKEKQAVEAELQRYYDQLQKASQAMLNQIAHAKIERHMRFAHHYIGVDDKWHPLPFANDRPDNVPWLFDGQIFFKPVPRLSKKA